MKVLSFFSFFICIFFLAGCITTPEQPIEQCVPRVIIQKITIPGSKRVYIATSHADAFHLSEDSCELLSILRDSLDFECTILYVEGLPIDSAYNLSIHSVSSVPQSSLRKIGITSVIGIDPRRKSALQKSDSLGQQRFEQERMEDNMVRQEFFELLYSHTDITQNREEGTTSTTVRDFVFTEDQLDLWHDFLKVYNKDESLETSASQIPEDTPAILGLSHGCNMFIRNTPGIYYFIGDPYRLYETQQIQKVFILFVEKHRAALSSGNIH